MQLPIVLPTIQFFNLDHAGLTALPRFIGTFMDLIRAPSLGTIFLSGWVNSSNQYKGINFPSVRHLILQESVACALVEIDWLAQAFPNIERLTCRVDDPAQYRGNLADVTSAIVSGDDEHTWPWPQLQCIAVSGWQSGLGGA